MHCFEDKEYQVDPQCNVKFDQQQIKLQSLMKPQVTKCSDTQVAHCTSKAPGVKAFKPPHNGRRQLQSDVKCDQLHALSKYLRVCNNLWPPTKDLTCSSSLVIDIKLSVSSASLFYVSSLPIYCHYDIQYKITYSHSTYFVQILQLSNCYLILWFKNTGYSILTEYKHYP